MSESWIGKQIKNHSWNFEPIGKSYHDPSSRYACGKKSKKKARAPKEKAVYPGQQVQIDTITRFDLNVKRYIVTAVDLYSRFAFAYTYISLTFCFRFCKISIDKDWWVSVTPQPSFFCFLRYHSKTFYLRIKFFLSCTRIWVHTK